MGKPLMFHVVAGYPDRERCLKLIAGMCAAGAEAVEVQVPFSDPIADGEAIMHANDVALAEGMTTAKTFELIHQARTQGADCDLYVMSYLQKVRHLGLKVFCDSAASAGVKGLIVPDLPYDSPEYEELSKLAEGLKLELVPVLSPGMPAERLEALLGRGPATVYVTSRRGITGSAYAGTKELETLVEAVRRAVPGVRIMIGFGIAKPEDVKDALETGDVAVVGSAVIRRLEESKDINDALGYVADLAKAAGGAKAAS